MDNLKDFLNSLEIEKTKVIGKVDEIIKETTFSVVSALLDPRSEGGTPILTGWLASNWHISIDSPSMEVYGTKKSVNTAVSKQNSSMDTFMNTDITEHNIIYINNSVPYGPKVNYGDGMRAPQNFREHGIAGGEFYLRGAKIK